MTTKRRRGRHMTLEPHCGGPNVTWKTGTGVSLESGPHLGQRIRRLGSFSTDFSTLGAHYLNESTSTTDFEMDCDSGSSEHFLKTSCEAKNCAPAFPLHSAPDTLIDSTSQVEQEACTMKYLEWMQCETRKPEGVFPFPSHSEDEGPSLRSGNEISSKTDSSLKKMPAEQGGGSPSSGPELAAQNEMTLGEKSLSGRLQHSPLSIMMSSDFIVSSPVRDNLLFTAALCQRRAFSPPCMQEEGGRAGAGLQGEPRVFRGHFTPRSPFNQFALGQDAAKVATEPNAGGASIVSESLSMEYFARKFGAANVVTEMEVAYENPNWKKVDYVCDIYGRRVGVSVTRAMSYPDPRLFSEEKAKQLLYKKLYGLVVARSGVSARHSFVKAILHVWCETERTAHLMQAQYAATAKALEVEEDVIMVLTVAEGWQARPIFYEACCKERGCNPAKGGLARHPWWWLIAKSPKKSSQKHMAEAARSSPYRCA